MISYKLVECENCISIPGLLEAIDCKLTEIGKSLYNSVSFGLHCNIDFQIAQDLLHYKRVLQYRKCNPAWAGCVDLDKIIGKVKLLIYK